MDASGRIISWIAGTGCEDGKNAPNAGCVGTDEGMDAFKDVVDGFVAVPSDSPALDDAGVVSIGDDMSGLFQEAR